MIKILVLVIVMLTSVGGALAGDAAEGDAASEAVRSADETASAIERLLDGAPEGTKVVTTASGLSYVDLQIGEGEFPVKGQVCTTHATLWLLDGTKVWSSRDPGPNGKVDLFSFALGRGKVIKGWDEGVASMKAGCLRRLAVPADLGYGAKGRPPLIPGGATLIFEVELISFRN